MVILAAILIIILIGGSAYYAGNAIKSAHETGKLTATPRTGSRGSRAKTTARNAPHNVRTIFAQAWADNWTAKKAHARETKAAAPRPPKPPRRPILQRLVAPGQPHAFGGGSPAMEPAASTNGHRPGAAIPAAQAPSATPRAASPRPADRPHLVPVPDPPSGRTAPMTSAPPAAAPTGAAADMFSSANALTTHAKAGGIHAKSRALKVFGEAFEHLDATLRALAQDMAEQGEYPSGVWEPIMTAAAHAKATALSLGEADASLTSLMNMNIGELAASPVRAPRNAELNRA